MDEAPPGGGPWIDEFQLPELDLLVEQPPALNPDALAQWLGAAAGPPAASPSADPIPLELTSSGGNSSGTTSTKSLTKEEEQLERARAQNRAKQSRFRQRQRERKEQLAAQYEATAADLEREQQLNASMKLSGATLECLRNQKEAAVQVLEAASAADQPVQAKGKMQLHSAAQESITSGVSSDELAGKLLAMPFRERVKLCCGLFRQTEPAHRALKEHAGEDASRPDGFALRVEVRKKLAGEMVENYPGMLKSALARTPDMLKQDWAELGELAAEVVQLHDDGKITEEEAEERICDAVMYFTILGTILLNHKPQVLQHLLDYHKLPGETDEQAATRWREVAIGMKLTEEQVRPLVPAFQAYCLRMQQLSTDTAAALESLREVQQRLNEELLGMGLSAGVQQYLQLFDAAGQLSHHSSAAVLITLDFMSTTGNRITQLQKARMMALCRPLHPNIVSIVREALAHYDLLASSNAGL